MPVTTEASIRTQRTGEHRARNFASGLVASSIVLLTTCGLILPRFPELSDFGVAVLQVAGIVAVFGTVLCAVSRWRPLGAGVVAGAALGLFLVWSGVVLYVGLFQL